MPLAGQCPFCQSGFQLEEPAATLLCPNCRNGFDVFAVTVPEEAAVFAAPGIVPQAAVPVTIGGPDAPEGAAPPAARPNCARHPTNVAATACSRCGDYICNVCATSVDGAIVCVPCFEHKHSKGELFSQQMSFTMPRTSMTCGIVSVLVGWLWCFGIILAPLAIVYGILSLREIRKQPALTGRNKAITGIVTGSIGLLELAGFITLMVMGGLE